MTTIDREIRRLARELADLRSMVDQRGPQLAFSSIENGALDQNELVDSGAEDEFGNPVYVPRIGASFGQQFDGTNVAATLNGPKPPTTSTPSVEEAVGGLLVSWDGYFVGDDGLIDPSIMPPLDWSRAEVHASQDPDDPADSADTLFDTIETPRGAQRFIMLPDGVWYVSLVVRSLAGLAGPRSATASGSPRKITADDVASGNLGGATVYRGTTAPASPVEGDLWFKDDGTGKYAVQVFDNGAWVPLPDATAALAKSTADAANFAANNIGPTQITDGAITTPKLAAGAVTAQAMSVGDFTNLIRNAALTSGLTGWSGLVNATAAVVTTSAGVNGLRLTKTILAESDIFSEWADVNPGDQISLAYTVEGSWDVGNAAIFTRTKTAAGVATNLSPHTGATNLTTPGSRTYSFTVPAGAVQIQFRPYLGATSAVGSTATFSQMQARRMMTGSLLVDGAIDGRTITGALFRTAAAPARRLELTNDGTARMLAYRGTTGETPGGVEVTYDGAADQAAVNITAPQAPASKVVNHGKVRVMEDGQSSSISLVADAVTLVGRVSTLGDLSVNGRVTGPYAAVGVTGGRVAITPTAANVPMSAPVTFQDGLFTQPPFVTATAETTSPGIGVTGVAVTNISTTGCTIWLTRTNTNPTSVDWIAIQP